ncbi:RDD family protein [Nocardioides solisilvae]|uniref:RDD family protein n=1 Tax=Nocardioides solisilvae TaxID=1542435 RepID=UPI000D74B42C|nr:RDD family protein [Nocardioides solisilvae]
MTPPATWETASWGQRLLALVVDWLACQAVVWLFLGIGGWLDSAWAGFATLGLFVVESAFLTAVVGGSFGQLVTRLRVVRVGEHVRPLELLPAVLRQLLVALVIPPLVFRPDGRGLHDLAVGSACVTLASLRPSAP